MRLLKLIPLSLFFVVNFSPLKVNSHYFYSEKDCTEESKDCFKAKVQELLKPTRYERSVLRYEHGDCIMDINSGEFHSYSKSEKKNIECSPN